MNNNFTDNNIENNEIIYNLYIDESGTVKNKDSKHKADKFFIVGGYLVKNVEMTKWKECISIKLKELIDKYKIKKNLSIGNNLIYHRTELGRFDIDLLKNVTNDIFSLIYEHNAKFVYMYDNNINDIFSTKYYYINFVALLVVKTLNKIIEENKYFRNNRITLNVIYASRQDIDNYDGEVYVLLDDALKFLGNIKESDLSIENNNKNSHYQPFKDILPNDYDLSIKNDQKSRSYMSKVYNFIPKGNNSNLQDKFIEKCLYNKIDEKEINAGIMESIEELKIKYGLLNNNISINLSCQTAIITPELVVADYFCNVFYGYRIFNKDKIVDKAKIDKEIFESIPNESILFGIPYSTFDNDMEIYFDKKDYYHIINKYVFYKKISKLTIKNKEYAKFYVKRIEDYIEKDKHTKKNRYLTAALESFLENIEYESNLLFNYSNIIETYDILIDFFRKFIKDDLLNAIIFTINTEKLAVYNHIEDYSNAVKIIEENNKFINYVDKRLDFANRLILFNNLSSVSKWHLYNSLESIKSVNNTLRSLESRYPLDFKEDIAKLYGTLGQSHIINYYVTGNKSELAETEKCFNKSVEILLSINSKEILREYNYLMLVYVLLDNEDKFTEYLLKYLSCYFNVNDCSLDSIESYIKNEKDKDKSYKYFIIRILKYCNSFDTDNSKKITNIIIDNRDNFIFNKKDKIEDIDIKKEYTLLCYKNNITDNYISDCHKFMENKEGYFDYMRRLSLYIIEILMDNNSNFEEALKIIEYLSNASEYYKQTFESIINDSKNDSLNKKEWALKVRNKLYM